MTLLAAVIKAAVDLYLGWRLVSAADLLHPASGTLSFWLIILALLLFYLFPAAGFTQYLLGGNVNILTYPKWMIYLFWFGFAFSFQVLVWIVGADLVKLTLNANGINAPFVDRAYGLLVFGCTFLVLLYSAYKVYADTLHIETDQFVYQAEGLPEELENFRIAHITDIQADRYTGAEQVAEYVRKTNEQSPDLVVITGDLISYGTDYVTMAAEALADLEAPYGVYFVVGDHDYWAGTDHITGPLRSVGINILEARNEIIRVGNSRIALSGLTNVYSRTAPLEEIRSVTQDPAVGKADVRIMLSHQVSDAIIAACREQQYHLLLAGHTHGGQIRVPLFVTKFSAPDFETGYVQGRYRRDQLLVNVNNGLGFTLAPVRYNAPPNISVIDLVGAE